MRDASPILPPNKVHVLPMLGPIKNLCVFNNCSLFRRYLGVKKVGGSGFKVSVSLAVVIYIWIHNVAFAVPIFMWADTRSYSRSGRVTCWPQSDASYLLASRIINFYLPLVITWASYIGIIYKLKHSMNKVRYASCEP